MIKLNFDYKLNISSKFNLDKSFLKELDAKDRRYYINRLEARRV